MPNADEAMAYTRTSTPQAALSRLADVVPLAVVTCGAEGAMAIDNTTGEHASAPGLHVDALDTTGAGDIFGASLVTGTLAGWPLVDRLRFANHAAALSVGRVGGAPAAPGWKGIASWWSANSTAAPDYAFLDKVIAEHS
jgi:sugar/nucleoside kinase (ribokinase family)